jgi:hypothetical protein
VQQQWALPLGFASSRGIAGMRNSPGFAMSWKERPPRVPPS